MKIIVLSKTDYKEKDIICDAISETESLSFRLPRANDAKSPYLWMNNPLTIAEVEFGDKRFKYPPVKEAKLISSPLTREDSLDYLLCLAVIAETAKNIVTDEERYLFFKDIEDALAAMKATKKYLLITLIFLARAIKVAGADLEVDKCVFCGNVRDIVAFSFPDGGFVCRNCYEENMPKDLSPSQMKLIRYLFRAPNYSCQKSEGFSEEDYYAVLKRLRQYIADDLGVYLKSVNALLK